VPKEQHEEIWDMPVKEEWQEGQEGQIPESELEIPSAPELTVKPSTEPSLRQS
jgi:hypothetical protein